MNAAQDQPDSALLSLKEFLEGVPPGVIRVDEGNCAIAMRAALAESNSDEAAASVVDAIESSITCTGIEHAAAVRRLDLRPATTLAHRRQRTNHCVNADDDYAREYVGESARPAGVAE